MTFPQALRRFWPDVRPYRWHLLLALLCAAIVPALDALAISLYGRLIDDVLEPRNLDPLPPIAAAYIGLTLAAGVLGAGRSYLSAWVSEHTLFTLRFRLFRHVQLLPSLQIDQHRVGDLITRLSEDVEDVADEVSEGLADAVADTLKVVFYTIALVLIDARLAIVAFVVAPPCWLLARGVGRKLKVIAREQRARDSAIASFIEENLANAFLVHSNNRQAASAREFADETAAVRQVQLHLTRLQAVYAPLIELIEVAGVLVVVAVGAHDLVAGRITLGNLLVFLAFLGSLYTPLRGLTHAWHDASTALASAERIIEVLDQQPDIAEPDHPQVQEHVSGDISLEQVSYRYPGQDQDALQNVSLSIPAGAAVALVGASGAGKSTVARLLLRLVDPREGRITLDGQDLRQLRLHDIREAVTLLPQEPLFFSSSVGDAIAYGRPGAAQEEVAEAAHVAGAAEFIARLADGYASQIGTRGRNLSGGQRQRLAIARAILRDAPVLILDEPTTGLDAAQSAEVLAGVRELMRGRTTVIISHDLDLVRGADAIAVLDHGQLVEYGTHDALLAQEGEYARIFRAGDGAEPTMELATP